MKKIISLLLAGSFLFSMSACGRSEPEPSEPVSTTAVTEFFVLSESEPPLPTEEIPQREENSEMKLNVQIGDDHFTATLENNGAVDAFVEMMEQEPVVVSMSDYSGFEKVGSLGRSLPASNSQTTTQAGDIVLYNGDQIVIFYGSNSWSYTRLARIDDLTGWEEALGSGDVTVTFSIGA